MSYDRTDKNARQRSRILRWGVLGAVFLVIVGMATAHQYINGAAKPVGVDALCPFGGIETIFALISGAGFVERSAASAVVLLVGALVIALVFRRSFCGQVCPLGALQGVFGAAGKRVMRKRPELPRGLDRPARYLKYAVLAVFVVWTWQAASLVMRPYDPWVAFTHITSSELVTEFGVGLGILVVSLGASLVYDRFFCKYLCPTGAVLGLVSKLSFLGIRRDAETCIDCKACDQACPMKIEVSGADQVDSAECISCNECVNACPAAGALEIKTATGDTASPLATTGVVAGLIATVIVVSTAAGAFAWTMPTLGEAVKERQKTVGTAGESAFDASLIKGYMSMREIADASGISAERFTEKWGVPAVDLSKPMKEIKDTYGFSPDDVRAWVAAEVK